MKKSFVLITTIVALVVICSIVFAACAPSNTEKAKAKMEKAGYTATVTTFSKVGDNGEVATVVGAKKSDGNILSQVGSALDDNYAATLYDSSKSAKAALEKTKDAEGKTSAVLAGKWVIVGSEAAIKAFKK